jgi:hypothetical protein
VQARFASDLDRFRNWLELSLLRVPLLLEEQERLLAVLNSPQLVASLSRRALTMLLEALECQPAEQNSPRSASHPNRCALTIPLEALAFPPAVLNWRHLTVLSLRREPLDRHCWLPESHSRHLRREWPKPVLLPLEPPRSARALARYSLLRNPTRPDCRRLILRGTTETGS